MSLNDADKSGSCLLPREVTQDFTSRSKQIWGGVWVLQEGFWWHIHQSKLLRSALFQTMYPSLSIYLVSKKVSPPSSFSALPMVSSELPDILALKSEQKFFFCDMAPEISGVFDSKLNFCKARFPLILVKYFDPPKSCLTLENPLLGGHTF